MNELDLRSAVKQKIIPRFLRGGNTLVFDELGIKHGAARIDIAVVNGIIHGFELKSDKDTLKRLPNQIRIYNSVLDKVTIIVGEKHFKPTLELVPLWWGVMEASVGSRGAIHFRSLRRPCKNPSPDPTAVAKLLWREEAIQLLEELGEANGFYSKPRRAIYEHLADIAPLPSIQNRVYRQLKVREGWRPDAQRTSHDG